MAKIFSPPSEVGEPPIPDWKDFEGTLAAEDKWVESIKEYARYHAGPKRDPAVGEEIRFPVADGYARYIVLSSKPLQLIHLPVGDAWQFQFAHRATMSDVRKMIHSRKKLEDLFSSKAS